MGRKLNIGFTLCVSTYCQLYFDICNFLIGVLLIGPDLMSLLIISHSTGIACKLFPGKTCINTNHIMTNVDITLAIHGHMERS